MKLSLRTALLAATVSVMGSHAAAQSQWVLTEATTTPINSPVPQGIVCSGYDASVCTDISRFYQFDHRQLWRFTLVGQLSENWGIRLTLITGAEAAKITVAPRLTVGVIGTAYDTPKSSLSAEVFTSLGGDIIHQPCVDAYAREYFCGALTAWADYSNKRIVYQEYGVKLIYRF
jgi:hypothetical protein